MYLHEASYFVHNILKIFGVIEDSQPEFTINTNNNNNINHYSCFSSSYLFNNTVDLLCDFRSSICYNVLEKKITKDHEQNTKQLIELKQKILELCDEFRDNKLIDLGIRLEDNISKEENNKYNIWKLDDPNVLKREPDTNTRESKRNISKYIRK